MTTGAASLVTSRDRLGTIVSEARRQGRIGLDTEFLRERTYRARLCLIQIATAETIYLLDPLEDVDLGSVMELLRDPSVEVVVHAGRQDLDIFYHHFSVVPTRVFDVQLAAGFAGYGASLPYGRLASAVIGASLEKGEAYSDWCIRPLSEAQLRYAADDVRFLIPIAEQIKKKLKELGREQWVAEEMDAFGCEELYRLDAREAWCRVSGRGSLSGRQAAVLREVAAWREESAARRDLPRGWLVKDPTLIEIARRQPADVAALKKIRGLNAKEADRSGRSLLQAVRRGQQAEPIEVERSLPRGIEARARMLSGLADAIVRARCEEAGVATELVATRADLEAVIAGVISGTPEHRPHRLLQGWRRELGGDAVVALAEGRIAVKAIADPPYIEEVEIKHGR